MNTPRFRPTVRAGRENVARSVSSCTSLVYDTRIELDVPGGSRCIALCTRRRVVAHVAVEGVPSRRTSSFSVARVSTPPVFAHSLMRSYRRVAMNIRRSCASSSLSSPSSTVATDARLDASYARASRYDADRSLDAAMSNTVPGSPRAVVSIGDGGDARAV